MSTPVAQVRKMLLLVPAAWRAGTRGLPLDRAVRVTGARGPREVAALVATLERMELGPALPEEVLLVTIEDGRVHVDRALHLESPPPLSLREGAALLAALRPFERTAGPTVASAARKLRRAIPEPFRGDADDLARALDYPVDPPGEWAEALTGAIQARREITVDYRAESSGTVARRTLEPRLLLHRHGHWYLVAWNVAKEAEHLYRLDRIAGLVVGTRTFDAHRGPPLDRLRQGRLYFRSGSEREVTVRFTGEAALLAVEQWKDRATRGEDGAVTVTVRIAPGNFLLGWVLGHGGQAGLVAPPDLREQLRERIEALRALYRDPE